MKKHCVDVIISNCVINLTPSINQVAYSEAFQGFKTWMDAYLISDLVTEGFIPEDIRKSFHAWSNCIAGAMERQNYIDTIRRAGFKDVEVVEEHFFTEPRMDERLVGKIVSIQVRAVK